MVAVHAQTKGIDGAHRAQCPQDFPSQRGWNGRVGGRVGRVAVVVKGVAAAVAAAVAAVAAAAVAVAV